MSMCSRCEATSDFQPAARRRKIWELEGGWGCSIVGTCVSLADLRALARKLGLKTKPDFPVDYQLHGHFTSSLDGPNRTGKLLNKMLNKMLDKKHAGAIRRFAKIRCGRALESHWAAALDAGDIPGPYWAILTHPHADMTLAERMFADVHMLSHMVGASNRADIRVLRQLEEDNAQLRDSLGREKRRGAERANEKQQLIDQLVEDAKAQNLARLRAEALAARAQARADAGSAEEAHDKACIEAGRQDQRADALAAALKAARADNDQLGATVEALRAELAALERTLPAAAGDADPSTRDTCGLDLDGRCILYVGGRSSYVCRLRALVEQWNGELLHHDGGVEKSIGELAGSVVRADAVVFPTDCVSHSAANKVKRLCRQTMKPFVPLRSSGVGSFVAGLQIALEHRPA